MLPSGAYATEDPGGRLSAKPRNTVFSLAALESLENTHGFRSGVFGLKQNVFNHSNSHKMLGQSKLEQISHSAEPAQAPEPPRPEQTFHEADVSDQFNGLSIPLFRRQLINKRAHTGKT